MRIYQTKYYSSLNRGYIAQNLKQSLKVQPIDLIIYHRKNMQTMN